LGDIGGTGAGFAAALMGQLRLVVRLSGDAMGWEGKVNGSFCARTNFQQDA